MTMMMMNIVMIVMVMVRIQPLVAFVILLLFFALLHAVLLVVDLVRPI